MPDLLDDAQKNHQRVLVIALFESWRGREAYDFDGIATDDEPWFHYHYEPREKFATLREKVTPFVRTQLGFQKGLIIVFYIYDADCK
jgi:hypothetical protein